MSTGETPAASELSHALLPRPRPVARALPRPARRRRDLPVPRQGAPGAFVAPRIGESSEIGLGGTAQPPLHGRPQRPATGHRIELCVCVDDVDAAYARARDSGFEAVAEPADMAWGERTAWIADPDGNLLMLTR